MTVEVRPATAARFRDVAIMLGPKRTVFERTGFHKAADMDAVSGGFPRVLMRLDLRAGAPGSPALAEAEPR